jgi:putative ATP-binding cassette transporter
MRGLKPFLKGAWRLALPYFRSEERWFAIGLLGVIIVMNLALENREFFNALQGRLHPTALSLPSYRQRVDARVR